MLLDFVVHSPVAEVLQGVVFLPGELTLEQVQMLLLNGEHVVDHIPVHSLSAWWSGQRSSVGPSWVVLDGVQQLANWNSRWLGVLLIQLQFVKDGVDVFHSEVGFRFSVVVVHIEQEANDGGEETVVFVFDFILGQVHEMDFKVVSLALDGVLRLSVPVELESLPQVGGLSVEVRVPRGELVGLGVWVEIHLGSVAIPFEFFVFDLVLVYSGPSLFLDSGFPASKEVDWRLSLSGGAGVLPVSSILFVVPARSRCKSEEGGGGQFEHLIS